MISLTKKKTVEIFKIMDIYNQDPKTISLYPSDLYNENGSSIGSNNPVTNYINSLCSGLDQFIPTNFCGGLVGSSNGEIDAKCAAIYEACKGWGTSEKNLIKALGNTSAQERKLISIRYEEMYEKELRKLMKKECGDNPFGEALQFLALGPVEAECRMLKEAVDGLGSNELLMYSILCGRSNSDMELLKTTFYKMFSDDLVMRMSGEVSGYMKTILLSTVQVRGIKKKEVICLLTMNIHQPSQFPHDF